MSGEQIAYAAAMAAALALPVLALRSRNVPGDRMWKMAAIWIALFALSALIFRWVGL